MNLLAISSFDGPLLSNSTVSTIDFLMPFTRSHISFNSALISNQYGRFSSQTKKIVNSYHCYFILIQIDVEIVLKIIINLIIII